MGGACHACVSADRHAPLPLCAAACEKEHEGRRLSSLKVKEHEGQRRSTLRVKDGGFALANIMVTNPGRIADFYDFEKEMLGEGGFGSVVRGKDKRTDQWFAVKRVRRSGKSEDDVRLRQEIEIMRMLDHPHIVRLVETFEDRKFMYLVMELCEGGELFDHLSRGALTERLAALCVHHMLLAINYLHQNFIAHRDLKPENWLLATKEEVGKAPLKLIDFGTSARFEPSVPLRSRTGTPAYTAPEVFSRCYDQSVDIWSLGVITYIMLSGTMPFAGNHAQILEQAKAANISFTTDAWSGVSEEAKTFVRLFMSLTPATRPTASQALGLEWMLAYQGKEPDKHNSANLGLEVDRLVNFAKMHRLKKAALTVVATQMSGARIESLKSLFLCMDANGDGTVSIKELKQALKASNAKIPSDLSLLLKEIDTDGSGVIDYTEFLAATMDKKLYHQEKVVWQAFKRFDVDDSGTIDIQELGKVLGDDDVAEAMHLEERGRGALSQLFNEVDTNGDGVIDFDEFFAMMLQTEAETSTGCVSPKAPHDILVGRQVGASLRRSTSIGIAGTPSEE